MTQEPRPTDQDRREQTPTPSSNFDTRQLFGPRREVVIEHEGVRYLLRITRRNKLILHK